MSTHQSRGPWSRRDFLRSGSAAIVAGALPRGLRQHASALTSVLGGPIGELADRDLVRSLAFAAVDAARSAGAAYADARVFREVGQSLRVEPGRTTADGDSESLGIGVRVLVDGQWGFAASPYWDAAEAATLARNAVAQARANAVNGRRAVDLGQYPVASGSWRHTGIVDPFSISLEEKLDLMEAIVDAASQRADATLRSSQLLLGMTFVRQERAVATTDGSFCAQTMFMSDGQFDVWYTDPHPSSAGSGERGAWMAFDGLGRAQHGWEMLRDARLLDQLREPERLAEVRDRVRLPHKPVDVGRYDIVFNADSVADLVEDTLGRATEIDRALGFEANKGGTTFLSDPLGMLGSYQVAAPLVTLTANRSMPNGLATAKWDDEGVECDAFALVKGGVLSDFQTTREQAAWLQPAYAKLGRSVRSHGCARSTWALSLPMQGPPNLVLAPGPTSATFADLVAGTKKGIAVLKCHVTADFQLRTGIGNDCVMREIVDGKLGAFIDGGTFLFNTIELWKSVVALGGAESAEMVASDREKGDPTNSYVHSVRAVPMKVHNVTIIERRRKA